MTSFQTVRYDPGKVILLDQTKLPTQETYVELTTLEEVARAIETMVVRGAPAIGITAAYGIALAAQNGTSLSEAQARLRRTRPTAVNLFWALDRMAKAEQEPEALEKEAHRIYQEDADASRRMASIGADLLEDGATVLTHCNAGALATAELGTALAVIRGAHQAGKKISVIADETRPVLQGARLTAWELMKDGIEVTVVADGAVAHLLSQDRIDCAVTGADRIAKNGDVANKIGTRGVACLLFHHSKPFYVAAPWSTVDLCLDSGQAIVIENRPDREVTHVGSTQVTPNGAKVENPAFDITPAKWISGIVTERGFTGPNVAVGLATQAR